MKKFSDLITTITPILNGHLFIDGLARNISDQECPPLQQIYSDNASSDDTWLRLQYLKKSDQILLHHEPHRLSAHGSWLAAASLAHTEYILLLPCDDRIHPKNIEIAHHILQEHSYIDVIGTTHFSTSRRSDLDEPCWHDKLTQSFEILNSSDVFAHANIHNFLPWPFTGLILRTSLFLEYLSTNGSEQFEGAGDLALTLWLISRDCTFARRDDVLTLAFRHGGQESTRLAKSWLADYIKLVYYILELEGLCSNHKIQACAYFMKALPRHLYVALGDSSQNTNNISILFMDQYPKLLRRCSELDENFSDRLKSYYLINEICRQFLLSMGSRRMKLLADFLRFSQKL